MSIARSRVADRFRVVGLAIELGHAHAPESDFGDFKSLTTKFSLVHGPTLLHRESSRHPIAKRNAPGMTGAFLATGIAVSASNLPG